MINPLKPVCQWSKYQNLTFIFSVHEELTVDEWHHTEFVSKRLRIYPNPFSKSTTIGYGVPVVPWASLKIYDLSGKEIVVLVSKKEKKMIMSWSGIDVGIA